MSLLKLEHINTGYDKKQVLFDVSLEVEQGVCVLLVGSNGSGKSTMLKAIYRQLELWDKKGKIYFDNEDITGLKTHQLIKKGLVYIPQKNELFEDLTVLENLELSILHLNDSKETKKRIESILEHLPVLQQKLKQDVHHLSGGERKILSLAMALLNKPKLLLYDEPLSGLSSENVDILLNLLKTTKQNGTTLVLVEHRITNSLPLCNKIIGLKLGKLNKTELKTLENIKQFMI